MRNIASESAPKALSGPAPSFWFTAAFWAFTYIVMTLRAGLLYGEDLELLNLKRVLTTGVGALVYLALIVHLGEAPNAARERRLKTALVLTVPAAALILVARLAFDFAFQETQDLIARNLLWVIMWTGYFAASVAAYVVYSYHRDIRAIERQPEATGRHQGGAAAAPPSFWVQRNGTSIRVTPEQIERFEAEGNYIRIHAQDGATGFVRLAMRRLADDLDPDAFIRVHRSTICRTSAITGLKRQFGGGLSVVLASGTEVAVGRTFAKAVLQQCAPTGAEPAP